jgi:hypothetical protein
VQPAQLSVNFTHLAGVKLFLEFRRPSCIVRPDNTGSIMKTFNRLAAATLVCAMGMGLTIQARAVPLPAPESIQFSWINNFALTAPHASMNIGSFARANNSNRAANVPDFSVPPAGSSFFNGEGATTDSRIGGASLYSLGRHGASQSWEQTVHPVHLANLSERLPDALSSQRLLQGNLSLGHRTTVPDGGATAMLLGAAFVGLGVARRFLKI